MRSKKKETNPAPGLQNYGTLNSGASTLGTYADDILQQYKLISAAPPKPQPQPSPAYSGVKVGETLAYRAWRVRHGYLLCSMAHDCVWHPGVPMTGNVDEVIASSGGFYNSPIMGGVYALKDLYAVTLEFAASSTEIVVGSVLLSGEVIEGTKGYRASVATIEALFGHLYPRRPPDIAAHTTRKPLDFDEIEAFYTPPYVVPRDLTEVYRDGKRVGLTTYRPHKPGWYNNFKPGKARIRPDDGWAINIADDPVTCLEMFVPLPS